MRQSYTRGTNLLREHGLISIPHSLPCQKVLSCPYMGLPECPPHRSEVVCASEMGSLCQQVKVVLRAGKAEVASTCLLEFPQD